MEAQRQTILQTLHQTKSPTEDSCTNGICPVLAALSYVWHKVPQKNASVISPSLFYRVILNFTWPLWKRDSWDRRRPFCQRSRDSFPLRLPGRQFSNSALRGSGMGEPNKTIFYQVKTKWFHIIHLGLSAAYKSKYEINCLNNFFPQYIWSPISYVWYLTILFAILFNIPSDLLLSPIWYSGLCLQLHNSFQPAYWFSSEFIIRVFKDKLGAASPSKVESQLVLENDNIKNVRAFSNWINEKKWELILNTKLRMIK